MPYLKRGKWFAQRQREGEKFHLGGFPSLKEALKREAQFDYNWPPNRGKNQDSYKERDDYRSRMV